MGARSKITRRNGLDVVELETEASTAAIAVQGAQVLSFAPRGDRDWLWVSERARWAEGAALRGGIPLCFPWFGPHPTERAFPAHGFARTRLWKLAGVEELAGRLRAELVLTSDDATRRLFPQDFEARLAVSIGAELALSFAVTNPGTSPLAFELALHSYFAVADVAEVAIEGLAGCDFVDKVAGGERRREGEAPIRIAGEVDRVYDGAGRVTLVDPAGARTLHLESQGAGSTVVWNPAAGKTATLSDLAPDGYRRFVCVESGAVGARRITVGPGDRHEVTVSIRAARPPGG